MQCDLAPNKGKRLVYSMMTEVIQIGQSLFISTGAISHLVKWCPYMYEYTSLSPRTHLKMPGITTVTYNPRARRTDRWALGALWPVWPTWNILGHWETMPQKDQMKQCRHHMRNDSRDCPLARMCTPTHTLHTHSHGNMQQKTYVLQHPLKVFQ